MSGRTRRSRVVEGRRETRIAAVGDVHYDGSRTGAMRELFAEVHKSADVLVLCGDLTTHGRPEQMKSFAEELAGIEIPIVTVLGNHDYESNEQDACTKVLCDAGVHVLDGTHIVIEG